MGNYGARFSAAVAASDLCQTRTVIGRRIRNKQERLVLGCRSAHVGEASWFGLTGRLRSSVGSLSLGKQQVLEFPRTELWGQGQPQENESSLSWDVYLLFYLWACGRDSVARLTMGGAEPLSWEKTGIIVQLSEQSFEKEDNSKAETHGYRLRSREGGRGLRKLRVA